MGVKIPYDTGYRLISPAIAIKSPTIIFPSMGLMLKKNIELSFLF